MVTLILLTLLVTICVYRLAPRSYALAWIGPLVGLLFLLLFGLESLFRGTGIFISDENFYLAEGRNANLTALSDRYLWVLINATILRFDWSAFGIPLKLVNLPLLALLVTLLWRIFEKERLVWSLPVVLPYVAYLATFNLRDTAILTATAGCVFFIDGRRQFQRLSFLFTLVALYLLRPPMALASLGVWLAVLAASGLRRVVRGRIPLKAATIVGGGLMVMTVLFAGPALDRVQRYYAWYEYVMGEGLTERALEGGLESEDVSGSWRRRVVVGAGKYTLAPMPTSLLTRIVQGGSEQWGIVDDSVRLLHQLSYYAILAFLVVRWRYWKRAVKSLTRGKVMLLLALMLYLPVYSIYQFGGGHQRTKIPFQLAIFLFAIVVHRARKGIWTTEAS